MSIQCWAIIGTPAKRHLNGVSLASRRWPAYSGIWLVPLSLPHQLKKKKKKNVKVGPPLTKHPGSAHGSHCAKNDHTLIKIVRGLCITSHEPDLKNINPWPLTQRSYIRSLNLWRQQDTSKHLVQQTDIFFWHFRCKFKDNQWFLVHNTAGQCEHVQSYSVLPEKSNFKEGWYSVVLL